MPQKLQTFLLVFLLITLLNAVGLAQYRFERWSTDNGLPQNGVRRIAQTRDGYLWFTTFDGLVRFDGLKMDVFNKANTEGILNNRFMELSVDKKGVLYASTEDGSLTIYKGGKFSTLTPNQVPNDNILEINSDENGETIFQIYDNADQSRNFYKFTDNNFIFEKKHPALSENKTYKGQSGRVWTFAPQETFEELQDKKISYPISFDEIKNEAVFEDSKGGLWVGYKKVYRLSDGKIETFSKESGLPAETFYQFFWEESDGSIWFISGNGIGGGTGLVQYKNGKFAFWNKENGLTNDIYGVFHDREGGKWLATDEGLFNRKSEVIKGFDSENDSQRIEAYPIFQDKQNKIWVGTGRGLFIFENDKFQPVTLGNNDASLLNNPKLPIQSLWQDEQENMWIGIYGAAFIIKNKTATEIKEASGANVFAIQPDKNRNVWLGTNLGVLQFKDEKLVNKFTVQDGLAGETVNVIFEDKKGSIWFGGADGIAEYINGKFKTYSSNEGFPKSVVRAIYEDADGVLWIGTYDEGLIRLKDGKFVNFKKSDGLFSDGVFAIREDRRGNFWMSSNQGVYRVNRRQLNDFADGNIKSVNSVGYGKSDGMLSVECNGGRQPASLVDKNGNFWFPTQKGIVRVNPEAENYSKLPPPVVIASASIEREPSVMGEKLTVPAGSRNVEINYSAISFNRPEQMRFKYKLEGYDADWIEADKRRSAFYSYIPPGDYVFRVKAANSEGVWNETGAELKIEAVPFFYQTNWFRVLCFAVFILTLFGLWRYWVFNFKRRERKLKELVTERTAELNNANQELEFLANSDTLTKISNRRHFEKFLKDEWNRTVRAETEISLLLLDADYFKLYNDTYGHQAGDICLQKIAQAISETVNRPTDLVARYGGEEFIVALGATDETGAIEIAQRILENVRNLQITHETSKAANIVTVSIGIASVKPTKGNAETDLIKYADDALYQAKANGRNQCYLFADAFDEIFADSQQIVV